MSSALLKNETASVSVPENIPAPNESSREGRESFWFVARGESLRGPYTIEQLKSALRKKDVNAFDFCWRHGFKEWRPIFVTEVGPSNLSATIPEEAPVFPKIPIPGQVAPITPAETASEEKRKSKQIRISFAKSPRYSITIYEWALAIIFSIGLAYAATHFALKQVQEEVSRDLDIRQLGKPARVGVERDHSPSVMAEFWEPLYSAPSLESLTELHSLSDRNPLTPPLGFHLSSKVSGHLRQKSNGKFYLDNYEVVGTPELLDQELKWEKRLDPAYSRFYVIRGDLNTKHVQELRVHLPADALLDVN